MSNFQSVPTSVRISSLISKRAVNKMGLKFLLIFAFSVIDASQTSINIRQKVTTFISNDSKQCQRVRASSKTKLPKNQIPAKLADTRFKTRIKDCPNGCRPTFAKVASSTSLKPSTQNRRKRRSFFALFVDKESLDIRSDKMRRVLRS